MANGSGAIPTYVTMPLTGFVLLAEAEPGTVTPPTNGYTLTVKTASTVDILGGACAGLYSSTVQAMKPKVNGVPVKAVPIDGPLTFQGTGNTQPYATGILKLEMVK